MKTLLFIAAGLMASTVMAASTGTLTLSGTVVVINELVITPINNTNLNILTGETDRKVADVSESSNSLTGYKITMRSANSSNLRHSLDATKQSAYTISYDGATAIPLTTTDQIVKTSLVSGLVSDSSEVKVNLAGNLNAAAGTYSDTVTISISAN